MQILCPLVALLPYTFNTVGFEGSFRRLIDPTAAPFAISHMAGALLAVDHFNTRNPSVVSRLRDLPLECNVTASISFVDSEANGIVASHKLKDILEEQHDNDQNLCALIGPYHPFAAETISAFAPAWQVPIVHYGEGLEYLLHKEFHPWSVSVGGTMVSLPKFIVSWLVSTGKGDYLAVIGSPLKQSTLYIDGLRRDTNHFDYKWYDSYATVPSSYAPDSLRGAKSALGRIKVTGVRNIFLAIPDHRPIDDLLKEIADAAEELQMNQGDHLWIINADLNSDDVVALAEKDVNVSKIVHGMAFVRQLDGFNVNEPGKDPFVDAWKAAGSDITSQLKSLNPVKNVSQPGYFEVPEDFFQKHAPREGTSVAYDAVMMAAISKCESKLSRTGSKPPPPRPPRLLQSPGMGSEIGRGPPKAPGPPGSELRFPVSKHMETLLYQTNFTGASGKIALDQTGNVKRGAVYQLRDDSTVTYGVYNFRRNADGKFVYYLTSISNGRWRDLNWRDGPGAPYVYANNSTSPPLLNRDVPEQNYISKAFRISGYIMACILIAAALLGSAWVMLYRNNRQVRQNQPVFLVALCVGAAILSCTIITLSTDEGIGRSKEQLDRDCMVSPWLAVVGYNTIYLALFSKLLRLDSVLQFKRRIIKSQDVIRPFVALIVANICVLIAWTIVNPLRWERRVINDDTEESYGECKAEDGALSFLIPIALLMLSSTLMCLWMAYKCRDVDNDLSESKLIFFTVFTQFQVMVAGIPVLAVLDDASADVMYWMRATVIFVVVFSLLLFMIGVKVKRVYFPVETNNRQSSRGSNIGAVRVTGTQYPIQDHGSSSNTPATMGSSAALRQYPTGLKEPKDSPSQESSTHNDTTDHDYSERLTQIQSIGHEPREVVSTGEPVESDKSDIPSVST